MKKLFSTRVSETTLALALFILRVGAGSLMMISIGYDKLQNYASKSAGFKPFFGLSGKTEFTMLVFAEFFCACLVLLGLFTRLACIPLVIAMTVALVKAHKSQVFGEGEHATLFIIGFLTVLILGPGKISVDGAIGK